MQPLEFVGDPLSIGGYSEHIRELLTALQAKGADLSLAYIQQDYVNLPEKEVAHLRPLANRKNNARVSVFVSTPELLQRRNQFNVLVTTFETTGLPQKWVKHINAHADLVVVPSEFNLQTFKKAGVRLPIVAVPEGYDPKLFNPGVKPMDLNLGDRYKFLSMFAWNPRKAWDRLLISYYTGFKPEDNVALVLKVHGDGSPAFKQAVRNNIKAVKQALSIIDGEGKPLHKAPIVYVIFDTLAPAQMASLYRGCDAFVLASRGEGWNRGAVHAAACGLPIITTGWSAHMDYLNEDNSYPVKYAMSPCLVPGRPGPYTPDMLWADVDYLDLSAKMRSLYEDHANPRLATSAVSPAFHWDNAATKFLEAIEPYLPAEGK